MFAKLFEVNDASATGGLRGPGAQPNCRAAPRQRNELKRTLLVYFDAQHNIKRTAEILGLHINTVRQRLETLREITGGWDDPVKALEMHVALRLNAILADCETSSNYEQRPDRSRRFAIGSRGASFVCY